MPQAYARDVAITAVICFIGGAGLALFAALLCYRASHKKKREESERQKEEEKEGGTAVNHEVNRSGRDENRREALLRANRESVTPDARLESHGGQFRSRADEDGYFRCPECSSKRAMRPNLMTWNNRINAEMEEDEEREKRTVRMVAEEERAIPNHAKVSSQSRRETLETLSVYETDRDMDGYRVNEGKSTLHCESCHRSYRATQQAVRPGRFKAGARDSAIFNNVPAHRRIEKGRNYTQFDMMRRESRNVTFDLDSLGIFEQGYSEGKDKREDEAGTPRDKERDRERRVQSSRLLKVKLNLNPLRKSKVHPRKKTEQDRTVEKGSSKKSRDKRQRGKDRREKGGKGKAGDKGRGSPEKARKPTRSRRAADDGTDVKEGDDKAEEKRDEPVQEQSTNPDNATSAASADQGPNSQGGAAPYQGAAVGSAGPFSLNHTTNPPLLGSAGLQLTGSRLSLQGGNVLLSSVAPRFPGPGSSAAHGVAISGPGLASSGALDVFSRQTGLDLMSPATSLLANTARAHPSAQTAPLYSPQAALNSSAALPEPVQSNLQTQRPPDSSSLPPALTCNPAEALGLLLIPELQAPQVKERLALQVQAADSSPGVSSQAPNAQTDTGRVPDGPAAVGAADAPAADEPVSGDAAVLLHQEYLTEEGGKLKLALPEKTSDRPPTALERKLR